MRAGGPLTPCSFILVRCSHPLSRERRRPSFWQHNHPSGDPNPSEADIRITRDLIRAGQLLKIEVLDHVILGQATDSQPSDFRSVKEMGYFYR